MALTVTPGSETADSYATLVECADYFSGMALYNPEMGWQDLADAQKEQRLKLAAMLMESLSYRGMKACRDQALAFPRWWPTDEGCPEEDDPYLTTTEITDAGYDVPAIPNEVKYVQCELAYQVVYKMISEAAPGDAGERFINRITVGSALAVEFGGGADLNSPAFSRYKMTAMSVVSLYLTKWVRRFTGGVV